MYVKDLYAVSTKGWNENGVLCVEYQAGEPVRMYEGLTDIPYVWSQTLVS